MNITSGYSKKRPNSDLALSDLKLIIESYKEKDFDTLHSSLQTGQSR